MSDAISMFAAANKGMNKATDNPSTKPGDNILNGAIASENAGFSPEILLLLSLSALYSAIVSGLLQFTFED